VSHYRVLAEFRTLRDAVRAAGLEPNPKGEKISTEDMLSDRKRVAERLGRKPSRAEYEREGKYSAGAFVGRFGSWSGIFTAKVAKNAKQKPFSRELTRRTRINQELGRANRPFDRLRAGYGHEGSQRDCNWDSVLRNFDRVPLASVSAPLVGMRKVTESVAQMVVNTLMGNGYWPLDRSNQSSALSIHGRYCATASTTVGEGLSVPNSPSQRAITALARQLPRTLVAVRAMSIS
jgi:hypothetical protein